MPEVQAQTAAHANPAKLPRISVVIATKNRDAALRNISLPSLARQQAPASFDVIICDASDNDASRNAVAEFAAGHPHIFIRHFKAPRPGLARQRNDALEHATGDVVFFIDDDSEVSADGLSSLAEMFAANPQIAGGSLPLDYRFPAGTEPANMRLAGNAPLWMRLYYRLFEPAKKASGYFPPVAPTRSDSIFYLFGCDMAFRREVFATHRFEERLQRFSNYALCDDLSFSRILIQQGRELLVATSGHVIHHAASGKRLAVGFDTGRVEAYNAGVVWRIAAFPWSAWSILPFLWARTGVLCAALLDCARRPGQRNRWARAAGYVSGLGTFFWEELVSLLTPASKHRRAWKARNV